MTALAAIMIRPALPWWILGLLVPLFAGLAWFTYRRCQLPRRLRWTLWGLRMAALAVMVWLVLLPVRRVTHVRREPSVLAVAVDVSASMHDDAGSRAARTRAFLHSKVLDDAITGYRTVFFEIGADIREREGRLENPEFEAPLSHIISGLRDIAVRLRSENVAGVVLLSDGLDHSGEALSAEARALPVYPVELETGREDDRGIRRDYFIGELAYPDQAVAGWDVRVDVLVQRRHSGDERCRINLYREGVRIATRDLVFAGRDAFQRASFDIHPETPGDVYYYVVLEPAEKDQRMGNNQREFMIHAVESKNRVLYLEGLPRWEFKFFKQALLQETAFKVSAYVRGVKGEFVSFDEDKGFTRMELPELTVENLQNYRVIVLGNLKASALSAAEQKNVSEFVEKGGGLLVIGGAQAYGREGIAHARAMRELWPVSPDPQGEMADERFQVDFTAAGRTHAAFQALDELGGLPPILSVWRPVDVHGFASMLMVTADGSPVIAVRRFGKGRVAMLLSDSMWRWQLSDRGPGQKSFYNKFVTQLTHWLAPTERQMLESNLLQLVMKSAEYEMRQPVTLGATYGEGAQPVSQLACDVITPEGRRISFPMQQAFLGEDVGRDTPIPGFTARFTPDTPGKYTVHVSNPAGTDRIEGRFLVKRAVRELTGAPANRELLQQIARESGGRYIMWEDRGVLLDEIPNRVHEIEISEEYPVWNRLPWFMAIVILFTAEWWLRRKHDLV